MTPLKGKKFIFAYPAEFTLFPEYSAHRGHVVTVVRRATAEEADIAMLRIRADDGWEGFAFPSELKTLEGKKQW